MTGKIADLDAIRFAVTGRPSTALVESALFTVNKMQAELAAVADLLREHLQDLQPTRGRNE